MRRSVPGLLILALAAPGGALAWAGASRPGRIVRLEKPAPDRIHVAAGTFTMGVPPSDVKPLEDECSQVTNVVLQVAPPASAAGVLIGNGEVSLCEVWGEALDRRALRPVWVDAFSIDRTEVTQAAYRACVQAAACSPVPLTSMPRPHVGPDLPVTWITRGEADTYCHWRGGRLPTEAEWEKAARGTDGRTWPWGDHGLDDDQVPPGWGFNHGKPRDTTLRGAEQVYRSSDDPRLLGDPDDRDGYAFAAPVGRLRWARGPYGTLDQAGNVAEWVLDDWSDQGYDGLPRANPVRVVPGGGSAITRGGSWRDPPFLARTDLPSYASASEPGGALLSPDQRAVHIGFRCVYGGAIPDSTTTATDPDPVP
ncbi:MAG TPA: SUMF1/EgtB/PvdO family nonheme iron enzyme [Kofleriaceae bacterium]|nr:SUMF1/EgtB/PvdO family nonheme iron enzyme [Kofleriaceae bacterium]